MLLAQVRLRRRQEMPARLSATQLSPWPLKRRADALLTRYREAGAKPGHFRLLHSDRA